MRKTVSMVSPCLAAVAGLGFLASGSNLVAQPAGQAAGDQRAARLKVMKRCAQSLKVTESDKPVSLVAEPILRYDDKARVIQDSTIWAWGATGRPRAVLKLESQPLPAVRSLLALRDRLALAHADQGPGRRGVGMVRKQARARRLRYPPGTDPRRNRNSPPEPDEIALAAIRGL